MPLADIELVKSVVVEAGKAALARWGTVGAEIKADTTLVTAVDRDTERFIEGALSQRYPDYAFVGEEYGWRGERDVPVWACDPIDGTTNYVYGLPHWCVSVGLIHEGVSQLGALYLPVTDELFWAVRSEGAFRNGERIHATDRECMGSEDPICFTSNASKTLSTEAILGRVRCLGSIASELAYTARGNLVATIGLSEGIVDIGAALCICSEAGCDFRYLEGPAVDLEELLRVKRTTKHFVYAPPKLAAFLQQHLRVRAELPAS